MMIGTPAIDRGENLESQQDRAHLTYIFLHNGARSSSMKLQLVLSGANSSSSFLAPFTAPLRLILTTARMIAQRISGLNTSPAKRSNAAAGLGGLGWPSAIGVELEEVVLRITMPVGMVVDMLRIM